MKNILLSIRPQYVAKILNGEKTIEIRKTMPKCDLPIDVYIYCTKKDNLGRIKDYPKDKYFVDCVETPEEFNKMDSGYEGNGKVVAKFTLNKVEEIVRTYSHNAGNIYHYGIFRANMLGMQQDLLEKSCLSYVELFYYLKNNNGYAWHIDNLVIFDKPKELSEFNHWVFYKNCEKCPYVKCHYDYVLCGQCCEIIPLTKAPQSWCYVEVE